MLLRLQQLQLQPVLQLLPLLLMLLLLLQPVLLLLRGRKTYEYITHSTTITSTTMILVSQPTEGVEETMRCGAGQRGAQQHSAKKKISMIIIIIHNNSVIVVMTNIGQYKRNKKSPRYKKRSPKLKNIHKQHPKLHQHLKHCQATS